MKIDKNIYENMDKEELNKELLDACVKGHLDIVKYLLTSSELKEHADINHKDNDDWNALMAACSNGNLEVVQYLLTSSNLKTHANIHHKNNFDINALMYAANYEHLEIVKYLVIDLDMKVNEETVKWLQGNNNKKVIYGDILKLIESRDLHQRLNNSINADKISNKKVKV